MDTTLPNFAEILINFMYILIGAMITSIILLFSGLIKRNIDKNNIIGILENEIDRNVNCIINDYSTDDIKFKSKISGKIYDGLLSSGNIKYFSKQDQLQLDILYNQFLKKEPELDDSILKNITTKLKYMHCRTRRWGIFFPICKYNK